MSDSQIKEAAAGVAVAHATGDEKSMKTRCWDLFQSIMWGQDGAKHLQLKITIVLGAEAIFLAGVLIDFMCGGALKQHGIHPREFPMGLVGIFFAPFLHRNIFHLLVNAVPFGVLSTLVMLRKRGISTYFTLTALTIVLAGTMVWTLGASGSNHIGCSGLIFSYFGYLVVSGVFRKSIRDFVVGAIVFLLYSSIFWGVLPIDERISWEAHLFGLLTGCAFGFIDARLMSGDDLPLSATEEASEEERERLV